MARPSMSTNPPRTPLSRPERPPAVTAVDLTKWVGPRMALDGASFTIPSGVVVGLVGPNGSGKSVLLRVLLGLMAPTSGTVEVLGLAVTGPDGNAGGRVGSLLADTHFRHRSSAYRNLEVLARRRRDSGAQIEQLLGLVGLLDRAHEPVGSYSHAMLQRLGIAAALLSDPDLVLLDEPTNALDPEAADTIGRLLKELAGMGPTVVMASHRMRDVEANCDWLVVLDRGRCAYAGPTWELPSSTPPALMVTPEDPGQLGPLSELCVRLGLMPTRNGHRLRIPGGREIAGWLNREAMSRGIALAELSFLEGSLEDRYLTLVGRAPQDLS